MKKVTRLRPLSTLFAKVDLHLNFLPARVLRTGVDFLQSVL